MSNVASTYEESMLTLGDRLNHPFLIANAILKFIEATVQPEGQQSTQQVTEAAKALHKLIPSDWLIGDKEYTRDYKKAVFDKTIDKPRLTWCGLAIGEPEKETVKDFIDPYALFHVCINVFQRRGLLTKSVFDEIQVPNPMNLKKFEAFYKQLSEERNGIDAKAL